MHFGKSLLWAGEDALTLYILVRFLQIEPALAGAMFLASALWNAVCDGVFGGALLRWPVLQRILPALSIAAILAAGGGFAVLPMLPQGDPLAAGALLALFRTGFSLADLPHNALTRRLALEHGDLGIARLRAICSAAAALVVGFASLPVLLAEGVRSSSVMLLIGAVGLVAMVCMLPLPAMLAREAVRESLERAAGEGSFIDPALVVFCAASAVGLAGLAAAGKAMLHLDLGGPELTAGVLLLLTCGRLAAVWFWSPVARSIGSRSALALAYGLSAMFIPLFALIPQASPLTVLAALGVMSLPGGGVAMLSWAVLSETIGGKGGQTPARYAAAFGLFTMSIKIALGLSGFVVGGWLASVGQSADIEPAAFWPLGVAVMAGCGLAALLTHHMPGNTAPSAIPPA
ncbi:MFS transporter [Aurantiacibacter xanthus]|uniref:MFS transporter n=1 Tax=Aurantiacibacter xanthus TaxID=1784712 RepID=UPI001C727804|nr:MFS transporter [Aurantiacibacter xanthus]